LYKSADNGISWSHIDLSVLNIFITELFASNDTLYVGCEGCGVYRSTDEAASFIPINNGFPGSAWVYSFAQIGQYLFTGLRGNGGSVGVYRSPVNAINWTQVNNGLIVFPSVIDMAVKGTDLIVTTKSFNDAGLFRSSDLGDNWVNKTPVLPLAETPTYLAVSGNEIYVGTAGDAPYKSLDEGNNWHRLDNGLKPLTVFSLLAGSNGVFVGYERGVARTTNSGASWDRKVVGLTNTSITSLFTDGNSTLYATGRTMNIGSNDGVFSTTDGGQTWLSIDQGLLPNPQVNAITRTGGNLIIGTDNYGLYIKTPVDPAFRRATGLETNPPVTALLSSGQYVLAAVSNSDELYRSTDFGLSWLPSNNGFGAQSDQIYTLFEKSGVFYAGGFNALYKSTDLGANWTWAGNGIYPGSIVNGITSLGTDLFASTGNNGIYKSSNGGANWVSVTTGLPPISHFNTIYAYNNILFAGSDEGVFRSDNAGNSWTSMNDGLLTSRNSLAITVFNNQLFLGTDETAVWGRGIASVLPVRLESFSGKEQNNIIKLHWKTSFETAGLYFEIERSSDGIIFGSIGQLAANASVAGDQYNFNDEHPNKGANYYRLVMIDIDGSKKYSGIILINTKSAGNLSMSIFPNPATITTSLRISGMVKGKIIVTAYDMNGRKISELYSGEVNTGNFSTSLDLTKFSKGLYLVQVIVNDQIINEKFTILGY
jgi:photosystem II stability/assembly factor-like uncharacterized protein